MRWALRQPVIAAVWTVVVLLAGIASVATTTETRVVQVASADAATGTTTAPSTARPTTVPAVGDESPTTTESASEDDSDTSTESSPTSAPSTAPSTSAPTENASVDAATTGPGDAPGRSTPRTNSTAPPTPATPLPTTPPPTAPVTTVPPSMVRGWVVEVGPTDDSPVPGVCIVGKPGPGGASFVVGPTDAEGKTSDTIAAGVGAIGAVEAWTCAGGVLGEQLHVIEAHAPDLARGVVVDVVVVIIDDCGGGVLQPVLGDLGSGCT